MACFYPLISVNSSRSIYQASISPTYPFKSQCFLSSVRYSWLASFQWFYFPISRTRIFNSWAWGFKLFPDQLSMLFRFPAVSNRHSSHNLLWWPRPLGKRRTSPIFWGFLSHEDSKSCLVRLLASWHRKHEIRIGASIAFRQSTAMQYLINQEFCQCWGKTARLLFQILVALFASTYCLCFSFWIFPFSACFPYLFAFPSHTLNWDMQMFLRHM